MKASYSQSFKQQAVEKALSRTEGTTLAEVAALLGIGYSTLQKWLVKAAKQATGAQSVHDNASNGGMRKEQRPQDWSPAARFEMVMACSALDEAAVHQWCRERGLYAHHVKQWKEDFISGLTANDRTEAKHLQGEIRALTKELNRKDRALAETAALWVLQKKVSAIWGNDADTSR